MRLAALLCLISVFARAETPDAGTAPQTMSLNSAPQVPIVRALDLEHTKWPTSCNLVVNAQGDLSLEGADTTPCLDKLEVALRLGRAARLVNRHKSRR